jgi:gliding motility-associated-like protein
LPLNVVNNGVQIRNTHDSVVIFGNVTHQNDGNISNDGDFYISGDWVNNNSTDNVFASGHNGWVHLDSGDQNISGSKITHFNNLELSGSGKKSLIGIDVEIEDTLAFNDRELDAGDNTATVLSTDSGVVTRTSGFLSSTNDGGLARNTLSTSTYFFPVGARIAIDTVRFRPLEINPNTADANTYKVRMANFDPTIETFDRTTKDLTVGEINQYYYHRIWRLNGTSKADITAYYKDTTDGSNYDIIAYWDETPEWRNPGLAAVGTTNYGLNSLKKLAFENFSITPTNHTPIALSHNVEISGNVFVANVFSPNGDGFNDFLFARGKAIDEIQFTIFDRWGEKVFETNNVNVGWDGTYKGEPLNTAVFVYIVQGKFKNGDPIKKKGNFTLLR